jgi:hypothetical protein
MTRTHLYAAFATAAGLCAPSLAAEPAAVDCHAGLYAFADGRSIDVGPSDPGKLRWRRPDGKSGEMAE